MKTWHLIRIASILALLYFGGHTAGYPWTPVHGARESAIIESMKTAIQVAGNTRSYWDFYVGFGLAISVYLLLQAVLLWQLAALARRDPPGARSMVASLLAAFAVNAWIAWAFFFPVPAILAIAVAACLAAALAVSHKASA